MSLINQMLNNLEARRADGAASVAREVRPLPVVQRPPYLAWGLASAALIVAVLASYHFWLRRAEPAAHPVQPPVALPGIDSPGMPVLAAPPPIASPTVAAEPANASGLANSQPPAPGAEGRPGTVVTGGAAQNLAPADPAPRPTAATAPTDPALRLAQSVTVPIAVPAGSPVSAGSAPAAVAPVTPSRGVPVGEIEKKARTPTVRERSDLAYRAAVAALGQGRGEEGAETLRAILREDPRHQPARQLLLKLLLDSRAFDELRTVLQDGLDMLPQQADWALLLGRLLVDRGDAEDGLRALTRSEAAVPANAALRGAAGAILQRIGRAAEAEVKYAEAVRLDPEDGRWMLGYALALEAQGKQRESREAFRRARGAAGLSPDLLALIEQKLH